MCAQLRKLLLAIVLVTLAFCHRRASAQTWNGAGVNDNWSTTANWIGGVAPVNTGAANVAFGGTARLNPTADVPWSINSITFNNTAATNLFTLLGSSLTIGAGGVTNNDADTQSINNGITLGASQTWNAAAGPLAFVTALNTNGNALTFNSAAFASSINGSIFGAGSLTKTGLNTLTLSGASASTFTGATTVNAGTLILAKPTGVDAFAGPLVIGDGSGSDTVQLNAGNQTNVAPITINSLGLFNLNGFNESISTLTLNNGSVAIGAGTLTVGSPLTMNGGSISSTAGKLLLNSSLTANAAAAAFISGGIDLGGAVRTFTIADGAEAVDLDVSAAISNGGITKTGAGTLRLGGGVTNTYVNITTVNAGILALGKTGGANAISGSLVIGDGAGGTNADVVRYVGDNQIDDISLISIGSSGLLDLNGFTDTIGNLALQGGNVQTGAGQLGVFGISTQGSTSMATIAGNLDLEAGPRTFNITETGLAVELEISAAIHNGDIIKNNIGTVRFSGATANTHGLTTVSSGTLLLNKTAAVAAIPGNLLIGGSAFLATVRLEQNDQIADTAAITINSNGQLDLAGHLETINSVNFPTGNALIATGAGALTLTGDLTSSASSTPNTITGTLQLSPGQHIFDIAEGAAAPDLNLTAAVTSGTFVKNGPGEVRLSSSNTASFILNAGTLTIGNNSALGAGTLTLNGGALQAFGTRTIANPISLNGPVIFDGANHLTLTGIISGNGGIAKNGPATLTLAAGSALAGNWTLNAGTLSSTTNLSTLATGSLTMNGGTFSGTLTNFGTLIYNAGAFAGTLINRGSLIINTGSMDIAGGLTNFADIAIADGQTLSVGGTGLVNNSQIGMSGTLTLNATSINNGSIFGFGTIGGAGSFTNNGLITQSGGNLEFSSTNFQTNSGNIDMASGRQLIISSSPMDNRGAINLNSGVINGTETLVNTLEGTISGRGTILTPFNNQGLLLAQGGALKIQAAAFSNSGTIAIAGLGSSLVGGLINNYGTVQGSGSISNDITNHGTIEAIGGTLILSAPVTNSVVGTIAASTGAKVLFSNGVGLNDGLISLTGGTFDNNSQDLDNTGQISGYGTFRAFSFTNEGSMTFSGGPSTINGYVNNTADHQIRVAHNPALFTGTVDNHGTFKNTGTTITFSGDYNEFGNFISDPADNFFSNVNIGPTGAWVGGRGDRFILTGDLLNSSTNKSGWQTSDAELRFTGGTNHLLSVLGDDLGITFAGYDNNFSWGILSLGPGDKLSLEGASGALYVRELILPGGLAQIENILGNGHNIYYDLGNPANAYLSGNTFSLAGGGTISPVPEPASVVVPLFASALLLAKRRRRNQHPFGEA